MVSEQVTTTARGTLRVAKVGGKVVSVTFVPSPSPQEAAQNRPRTCTDCGVASDNLRWFPFTTYACPSCAAKLDAIIEQQRRTGQVCRFCRQPHLLCVC